MNTTDYTSVETKELADLISRKLVKVVKANPQISLLQIVKALLVVRKILTKTVITESLN